MAGFDTGYLSTDSTNIDKSLTVVTNSFAVATRLADRDGIELMMLGGRIRTRIGAAVGEWTIGELRDVYVDVAFLGTNGFSVERVRERRLRRNGQQCDSR